MTKYEWNRGELKANARALLGKNYWRMTLVAFLMSLTAGGVSISDRIHRDDIEETINLIKGIDFSTFNSDVFSDFVKFVSQKFLMFAPVGGIAKDIVMQIMAATVLITAVVGIAISIALLVLVFFPLHVGCAKFFLENRRANGEYLKLTDLGFVFRSQKMLNVGKTMFIMNLFVFLWSLLLIVPGIVKAYSYRMVPFILADNPEMEWNEVIKKSEDMMYGHKMNAFLLDLSFIGWYLFAVATAGIVGVFYLSPYKTQTNANLYRRLNGDDFMPDYSAQMIENMNSENYYHWPR